MAYHCTKCGSELPDDHWSLAPKPLDRRPGSPPQLETIFVLLYSDYDDTNVVGIFSDFDGAKAKAGYEMWTEDIDVNECIKTWLAGAPGEWWRIEQWAV